MNTPPITTQTKTRTKTKTLVIILLAAVIALSFGYGITFQLKVGPVSAVKGLLTGKGFQNVEVGPNTGQIYSDMTDGNNPWTDPNYGETNSNSSTNTNTSGGSSTTNSANTGSGPSDTPWLR
jgi:hypothetical protein